MQYACTTTGSRNVRGCPRRRGAGCGYAYGGAGGAWAVGRTRAIKLFRVLPSDRIAYIATGDVPMPRRRYPKKREKAALIDSRRDSPSSVSSASGTSLLDSVCSRSAFFASKKFFFAAATASFISFSSLRRFIERSRRSASSLSAAS